MKARILALVGAIFSSLTFLIAQNVTEQDVGHAANDKTTQVRIRNVENGLLPNPVVFVGQPTPKLNLLDYMKANSDPGISIAVVDDGRLAWGKIIRAG